MTLQFEFNEAIVVCLHSRIIRLNATLHTLSSRSVKGNSHPSNIEQIAVRDIVELFGVDGEGPLPEDIEEANSVVVNDPPCPLDQVDEYDFMELFEPLTTCDDYGKRYYALKVY